METEKIKTCLVKITKLMLFFWYDDSIIRNVLNAITQILYSGTVSKEILLYQVFDNAPELYRLTMDKLEFSNGSADDFIELHCKNPMDMVTIFIDALNDHEFFENMDIKDFEIIIDKKLEAISIVQ